MTETSTLPVSECVLSVTLTAGSGKKKHVPGVQS